MVEAMVALTLVDALMMQTAQCELFENESSIDDRPNPIGVTAERPGGPKEGALHSASGPVGLRVDEE